MAPSAAAALVETPGNDSASRALAMPIVWLLFVGSGAAALIYEIVWLQLLQLVIGSSAVSLGVLLATFMGGMCLGSVLLPWAIPARWHALRVYALLELGIGVCGVVLLVLLPRLDDWYLAGASYGGWGIARRALVAAVCLLPPTVLMGATLPAVARWVEATPQGVAWLGFFYGGNLAGAVLGCLSAGFVWLRLWDMPTASGIAAAINGTVAGLALLLARRWPQTASPSSWPREGGSGQAAAGSLPAGRGVYLAIGLSGLAALGAEVVWTRLLSLLLGGTVYTFSIILAVFLIGLGIGSSGGAALARRGSARWLLGLAQLLVALAIYWAAWQLGRSVPYWPIQPALAHSPWHTFQLDLLRCLWVTLPAATLWGASFPLALAAAMPLAGPPATASGPAADTRRVVGKVYAANTLGAIAGALGVSIPGIALLGTQHTQQALMGVSLVAAAAAFLPWLWAAPPGNPATAVAARRAVVKTVALGGALLAGGLIALAVPPTPPELIAYGRYLPRDLGSGLVAYWGEGQNASVAVTVLEGGTRNFHVSGKIEASSEPQDMRLQRMLGHLPALLHPQPESVLVVGCGAGVTAGCFVIHPSVKRIVICEIEPLIPRVVAEHFTTENYDVVHDRRVEIVYDDARHYILTTGEQFDIITSDPIHPWVKGAATLYTQEYFTLCRKRLKAGGLVTQWVPLYESTEAAVKSEMATFFEVFPEGSVWSNDYQGLGYDVVLLGQAQPGAIHVDQLMERLAAPEYARVRQSLDEVGFASAIDLLATFAGLAEDLRPWLADAAINRDRNLRLQYLAGLGASSYREGPIFSELSRYRRYPARLFTGSPQAQHALQQRLGMAEPRP
jgi:spermidine synthase